MAALEMAKETLIDILQCAILKTNKKTINHIDILKCFSHVKVDFQNKSAFISKNNAELLYVISCALKSRSIDSDGVSEAVKSKLFLDFDRRSMRYSKNEAHNKLVLLKSEISKFNSLKSNLSFPIINKLISSSHSDSGEIAVSLIEIILYLSLLNAWSNTITIASFLLKHIEKGIKFDLMHLMPKTPIPQLNIELENESCTRSDVEEYITQVVGI